MTRYRHVPNSRELRRGITYSEINLCFLIFSCLIFESASIGEFEFRCRTFWAGDFPFAFS